jgi:hypothetical protein
VIDQQLAETDYRNHRNGKPAAMLSENRIAVCPKSKDNIKCYKAAIETAITLKYEKKKECITDGKSVPDGSPILASIKP